MHPEVGARGDRTPSHLVFHVGTSNDPYGEEGGWGTQRHMGGALQPRTYSACHAGNDGPRPCRGDPFCGIARRKARAVKLESTLCNSVKHHLTPYLSR